MVVPSLVYFFHSFFLVDSKIGDLLKEYYQQANIDGK